MKADDPELLSFVPGRMVIGNQQLNNEELSARLATLARMCGPGHAGTSGQAMHNEVDHGLIMDALGVLAEQMIGRHSPADDALRKSIQAETDRHRGR